MGEERPDQERALLLGAGLEVKAEVAGGADQLRRQRAGLLHFGEDRPLLNSQHVAAAAAVGIENQRKGLAGFVVAGWQQGVVLDR